MSRARRRISRGLIGLLVVTIGIGLVFYFHDTSRTKATEASSAEKSTDTESSAETTESPSTKKSSHKKSGTTEGTETAPSPGEQE